MSKKAVFELVKEILEQKPQVRDNDMYLVATVWYRDISARYNINQASAVDFFHLMRNYKRYGLLSYETISRQRRLVQEAHAELRGEEYYKRRGKQEEVKADIKAIKAEKIFGVHIHKGTHNSPNYTTDTAPLGGEDKPNENLLNGQQSLFSDVE